MMMIYNIIIVLLLIVIVNSQQEQQQQQSSNVLQINCSNADNRFNSPAMCGDYILQYIQSYTGNGPDNPSDNLPLQGYDTTQFPYPPNGTLPGQFNQGNGEGIIVYIAIEVINFVGIDTSTGVVTTYVNFILLWNDFRLAWNASLSEEVAGVYYVYIGN